MPHRIRVRVYRRADRKFYQAEWTDPDTGLAKIKSLGTTKKREADRKAGALEDDLNSGAYRPDLQTTWAQFRKQFEKSHPVDQAPETRAKYTTVFNHVERLIKPRFLSSLGHAEISRFQILLKQEGARDATIRSLLTHLKIALRWAVRTKLLHELPDMRLPRVAQRAKGRPITEDEYRQMIAAVPVVLKPIQAGAFEKLIRGLWLSGLRLSEACELRWNDGPIWIDYSGRYPMFVIVSELDKARKERRFPIAPEFAEMIASTPTSHRDGFVFDLPPERPDLYELTAEPPRLSMDRTSELVQMIGEKAGIVVGRRGGRAQKVTSHRTQRRLARLAEAARREAEANGITDFVYTPPARPAEKYASAHDLRRSFGFRWAMKVKPAALMALMRHRNIATTMQFYVGQEADQIAEVIWGTDDPVR